MRMHVALMRYHGKALDQRQIRSAQTVEADIIVMHENVTLLNRYSDVAKIAAGDAMKAAALPPLYDCRLSQIGNNGFVLSGWQLEGSIAFEQAWWCRIAL